MTDKEALTKAIEKAVAGGWMPYGSWDLKDKRSVKSWELIDNVESYTILGWESLGIEVVWQGGGSDYLRLPQLIFNHNFAKALWGDLPGTIARHVDENGQQRDGQVILEWQYHLQQMVIADDPIKYLGDSIGE